MLHEPHPVSDQLLNRIQLKKTCCRGEGSEFWFSRDLFKKMDVQSDTSYLYGEVIDIAGEEISDGS